MATNKKKKKNRSKRVLNKPLEDKNSEDTDGSLTDSTCRLKESNCMNSQGKQMEPRVPLKIKSRDPDQREYTQKTTQTFSRYETLHQQGKDYCLCVG